MNGYHRPASRLWTALFAAALLVASGHAHLWAQCAGSLTITRTTPAGNLNGADQDTGLTGDVWVFFQPNGLPNTITSLYTLKIYGTDSSGTPNVEVYEQDGATASYTQTGELYFDWQTSSMRRPWGSQTAAPQPPVGPFLVQVFATYTPPGGPTCSYQSSAVTRTLGNPLTAQTLPSMKLEMVCGPNDPPVPTGSDTDPMTGNQSWSIPVTSWPYKHNTYGLTLSYASVGTQDANNPDAIDFAGLSEHNSHWTHNYAMWLSLPNDETGAGWAVVHRPGHNVTFKKPASGTLYTSIESFDTLTASATTLSPTVTYTCNGSQGPAPPPVPSSFALTDRDGATYTFSAVANGGTSPIWQTGPCTAIPYWLLTQIKDRWQREVDITWTDVLGNGLGWRVTQVSSPGGPTLTLTYSGPAGMMQSVRLSTDPAGVNAATMSYTSVMDETNTSRQKLTTLTVNGPAAAATRSRTWSFVYRDPATESNAYGGTITGDLVIRKTQPDGLTYSYTYEAVTIPRASSGDYDGRIASISWPDASEGPTVTRQITRSPTSMGGSSTLTFPGGVQTEYDYSGSDLTKITELPGTPAARAWTYHYDSWHNLTDVWSPLEPTGGTALIHNAYTEDSTGHISKIVTTQPYDSQVTPTISVDTYFNQWNLPTQIVAHHDLDPNAFPIGLANFPHYQDQLTTFGYDEGLTPALGNLTSINRQDDTGHIWSTTFQYDVPVETVYGPPGHVTNDVGGQSAFTYDSVTGLLISAASPLNTVVGSGPDYSASVTQITGYEEHGLPLQVQDPMSRLTSTAYQGDSGDARYLDVTTTFAKDNTSRVVQLDPMDRIVLEQDERGIRTALTYNPQGQVKTVTRNSGDTNPANRRTTVYFYNAQGDVYAMYPPIGMSGGVQFDYRLYKQDGTLYTGGDYLVGGSPVFTYSAGAFPNGIYMGRLCRIAYADGRAECFGYNAAGELWWKRKGDGTILSITRDVQHRVKSITYPTAGGGGSFTVTRLYDEFGRPKQLIDLNGTTDKVWDSLNRPAHTVFPAPQDSLDFSYQADSVNHRWTTTMNVSGLGVYQFSADSKGRPFQTTNTFGQTFTSQYYLDGQARQRAWPNGVVESRSYNPRGFLSGISLFQQASGLFESFSYACGYSDSNPADYDGTGHIRREVDAWGNTHAFFFDNLYQLVGESAPELGTGSLNYPYDINYTYDLNGNRASRSQAGNADYYGVDAADRLLWINRNVNAAPTSGQASPYTLFWYDLNDIQESRERRDDNGVWQQLWFWWDGDDRMRNVTTTTSPSGPSVWDAHYNGDGIRTSKDDIRNGAPAHNDFSYSPYGLLWSSNPNTVYTPGFGHRSNGIYSFYQVDWLGSTRYVTDITGGTITAAAFYDAWGNKEPPRQTGQTWPSDLQWAGGWGYQTEWNNGPSEPGIGLDYLQQRYYDPVIGRFISPDPAGFAAGNNLYLYADDDPVNGTDPTGLDDPAHHNHLPPGVIDASPTDEEGDEDPDHVMDEGAALVEPPLPGGPAALEAGGAVRFDPSVYRALGMTPPNINMLKPQAAQPLWMLAEKLPPEFRAELESIAEDIPDYLPEDPNTLVWARTPAENRECRRGITEPGHHRVPTSMGGHAAPPEGLLETGDTRTWRNPDHGRVTTWWYRAWNWLRSR